MNLKNKFIFPFLIYILMYAFTVPFVLTLKSYLISEVVLIIHKLIVSTVFLWLISKYINNSKVLFKVPEIGKKIGGLILMLLILFAVNNYFLSNYSIDSSYLDLKTTILGLYLLLSTVSSTAEEIIYRGFIQSYTNESTPVNNRILSQGNLYATCFFLLAHIGFYTIMDPLFATTSLLLLIVFSLTVGYIRDKTENLILPIIIHILCNYIHIAFHWHHFS